MRGRVEGRLEGHNGTEIKHQSKEMKMNETMDRHTSTESKLKIYVRERSSVVASH